MMIQNILLADEGYTHSNWVYRDVNVGFSRLYYIIDGEAYYEEEGRAVRFQRNHLYLTPVKKCFTLYENPNNKLLHTYSHVTTFPTVDHFIEVEVVEGTPLADAVALWRKYIHSENSELLENVIRFLLSCMDLQCGRENSVAVRVKQFLDDMDDFSLDMTSVGQALGYSREHITRSFLSTYHVTPKQYFNKHRMTVALERLQDGMRVSEVADAMGFASSYSFSKAFKKNYGLSPEKYLQTLRAETIGSTDASDIRKREE